MAPFSVATRNYGVNSRNQVANLGVPPEIKCNVCKKTKKSSIFSQKQRDALLDHMRKSPGFNPGRDAYAVCTSCTSQQVHELKCHFCGKTKGLNAFAKNQRRTPDHARCMTCQREHAAMEPDTESEDDSGSGSDDEYSHGDTDGRSSPGGASLVSDMASLSTRSNEHRGTVSGSSIGGVSLNQASDSHANTFAPVSSSTSTISGPRSSSSALYSSQISSSTRGSVNDAQSVTGSSSRTATCDDKSTLDGNRYSNAGRRAPVFEAGASRSAALSSNPRQFAKIKSVPAKGILKKADHEQDDAEDEEHEWVAGDEDDSD